MAGECEPVHTPRYLETEFGLCLEVLESRFTPEVSLAVSFRVSGQKVAGVVPLGPVGEHGAQETAAQLRALADILDPEGGHRG